MEDLKRIEEILDVNGEVIEQSRKENMKNTEDEDQCQGYAYIYVDFFMYLMHFECNHIQFRFPLKMMME